MKATTAFQKLIWFFLGCCIVAPFLSSCMTGGEVKAEEYYTIGMAYYELGKYEEAEQWLRRARTADKTMTASEYNLGKIAFETERFGEAALHFERVLKQDPDNVMALKSAAYSRIKNGDLEKAKALYERVLVLIPESSDDGFNYALVLYGMGKYEASEDVLNKYPFALEENTPSMLLFARAQSAQNKIEAVNSYDKWAKAASPASAQGLYEYAKLLEAEGFYARALEQYTAAQNAPATDTEKLKKSSLMFEEARLLLTADPESTEGIAKLSASVAAGFSDTAAIETLLQNEKLSAKNKEDAKKILDALLNSNQDSTAEAKTSD